MEILIPEEKTNRNCRDENKTGCDHFLRHRGALENILQFDINATFQLYKTCDTLSRNLPSWLTLLNDYFLLRNL